MVTLSPVRCPWCNKKLAEHVIGVFITRCPRCHQTVRVDRKQSRV